MLCWCCCGGEGGPAETGGETMTFRLSLPATLRSDSVPTAVKERYLCSAVVCSLQAVAGLGAGDVNLSDI